MIVFFSNLLMIVDVAFFTSTHRNGGNSSGEAVATRAPQVSFYFYFYFARLT
jgi:hypothetical protein